MCRVSWGLIMGKRYAAVVMGAWLMWVSGTSQAQDPPPSESESPMTRRLPVVGVGVGDHRLYDESGSPFPTSQFRDHYTVLVFGCLT